MTNEELIHHVVVVAARMEKLNTIANIARRQIDEIRMVCPAELLTKEENELLRQAGLILLKLGSNTSQYDSKKICEKLYGQES